MTFQFLVRQVWTFEGQPTAHVIGVLEEGTILPPMSARVADCDQVVEIESVALGGGRPITGQPSELTIVVRCPGFDPKSLEGTRLVSV